MPAHRWQDGANLILGLWLLVSPWTLDYRGTTAALNAYAVGAGLMVFALLAAYMPKTWEEVINTLIGVWLIAAPFLLNFLWMRKISLHTVVVGILATSFAVWALFRDQAFYNRWHDAKRLRH